MEEKCVKLCKSTFENIVSARKRIGWLRGNVANRNSCEAPQARKIATTKRKVINAADRDYSFERVAKSGGNCDRSFSRTTETAIFTVAGEGN